jgi:hypothetical protein
MATRLIVAAGCTLSVWIASTITARTAALAATSRR